MLISGNRGGISAVRGGDGVGGTPMTLYGGLSLVPRQRFRNRLPVAQETV